MANTQRMWNSMSLQCRRMPARLAIAYFLRPPVAGARLEIHLPGEDFVRIVLRGVYKEVEIINQGLVKGTLREPGMVTVSYDEKPGIQALSVTTPDRPPAPGLHASHLRDYEYKRLGTVSLLAGLDLHSGKVTEIVSDTHKSRDFIELLTKLDAAYPSTQILRLILDNHSAHISKETQRYLASRPQRFQFVFIPKHGSWLNLVENLFSKMTRTMLREIRVSTKQELIDRIHLYFQETNAAPVIFHWKYKMDETTVA